MAGSVGGLSGFQKALGAVLALTLLSGVGGAVVYYYPTATNQGYAPPQPIPFSHKLHAGQHKIDCRYCHVGVTKSAHATVPGMNVCMNCHSVVAPNSPHIQKLKQLYAEGKPIEWVRIHELPDHAHFNHKRHVTKGISCETCHGDVKSMDRVYQYAPLTMGWCLECHRGQTTPSKLRATMHPDGKDLNGPVAPFQCSTCHY
jgi:hypothetical protein